MFCSEFTILTAISLALTKDEDLSLKVLPCMVTDLSLKVLPCMVTDLSLKVLPCMVTDLSLKVLPCMVTDLSLKVLPCMVTDLCRVTFNSWYYMHLLKVQHLFIQPVHAVATHFPNISIVFSS